MIIFAGIVSSILRWLKKSYENAFVNVRSGQMTNSPFCRGINLAVLVIVYLTTFVEQAQYKIPIQYTRLHKERHQVLTFLWK